MKPVKIVVAGTANPHIPAYLRGVGRDIADLEFLAVADFDERRLGQAREFLKGASGFGVGFSIERDKGPALRGGRTRQL